MPPGASESDEEESLKISESSEEESVHSNDGDVRSLDNDRLIEAWRRRRNNRVVVPLDSDQVRRTKLLCCLRIEFSSVSSFVLPTLFRKSGKKNTLEYSLQVSLFHSGSGTFFGNTWVSPMHPCKNSIVGKKSGTRLNFENSVAYICTRIVDPSCVAVGEIVIVERDAENKQILGKYGCGWANIPLFSLIPDIGSHPSQKKAQMYSGSPRALLFLVDDEKKAAKSDAKLQPINGSTISFQVNTDKDLAKIAGLVRVNELISPNDLIPGMKNSRGASSIPIKSASGIRITSAMNLYLNRVSVVLPVDWQLHLNQFLSPQFGVNFHLGSKFILKVGPHNGLTVVSKSGWVSLILKERDFDNHPDFEKELVYSKPIKISGCRKSAQVALAFELQLMIEHGSTSPVFTIGSGIWLPFLKSSIVLSNVRAKEAVTGCPLQLTMEHSLNSSLSGSQVYSPPESLKTNILLGAYISLKPEVIADREKPDEDDSDSDHSRFRRSALSRRETAEDTSSDGEISIPDSDSNEMAESDEEERSRASRKALKRRPRSEKAELVQAAWMPPTTVVSLDETILKRTLNLPIHNTNTLTKHIVSDNITKSGSYKEQIDPDTMSNSLTRASRTMLSRNGFVDVSASNRTVPAPESFHSIEVELRDRYKASEITIQFAAFRHSVSDQNNVSRPKSVFFTFQLYNMLPTRTEKMLLREAGHPVKDSSKFGGFSNPYILTRADQKYRNSPSLALKYVVDTTSGNPDEPVRFAEYLNTQSLFVVVWDGESLLQLGTMAIRLQDIMRQGDKRVKTAKEYDVIQQIYEANANGINEISVFRNGLGAGIVNGKVQVVISNYGMLGVGKPERDSETNFGTDWRLQSSTEKPLQVRDVDENMQLLKESKGPKYRVVAKPLAKANPELENLLEASRSSARMSHHLDARRAKKQGMLQLKDEQTSMQSEWTFSQKELGRLDRALDRDNHGIVNIVTLASYLDLEKVENTTGTLWAKLRDSKELTFENARAFNRADTSFSGRVPAEVFEKVLNENLRMNLSRDDIQSLVSQFGHVTSGVDYEKFLSRALDDSSVEIESKLRRILGKAQESSGISAATAFRQHFDANQDGVLERQELFAGLSSLGLNASRSQMNSLMARYGDGSTLRISDFISIVQDDQYAPRGEAPSLEEKLRKVIRAAKSKGVSIADAFKHFDQNGDGMLTSDECCEGLRKIGMDVGSNAEIRKLFASLDVDGSGSVNMSEFLTFLDPSGRDSIDLDAVVNKVQTVIQKAQEKGLKIGEIFDHFDKDHSGTISKSECKKGLEEIGLSMSDDEITGLFKAWDIDGGGSVNIDEFVAMLKSPSKRSSKKPTTIMTRVKDVFDAAVAKGIDVRELFEHFDKDRSGSITKSECKKGLEEIGLQATDDEITELFKTWDLDGGGDVNLNEFISLLKSSSNNSSKSEATKAITRKPLSTSKSVPSAVTEKVRRVFDTAVGRGIKVNQIFEHFDKDNSGTISKRECEQGFREMGLELNSEDIEALFDAWDVSGDGTVSLQEIFSFMEGGNKRKPDGNDFLDEFLKSKASKIIRKCRTYDRNDNGTISISRLAKVLESLGYDEALDENHPSLVKSTDDPTRVQYEQLGSDLIRDKLKRAAIRAGKKGIDVMALIHAKDRTRSGKLSIGDMHKLIIELGFSILEESSTALVVTDREGQSSRQMDKIQHLRRSRVIHSNKESMLGEFAVYGSDEEMIEQDAQLDVLRRYREGKKRSIISNLLKSSMTKSISLGASFGSSMYFEVSLKNPYPHEERFKIEISDQEIRCLTSTSEWRFYRDYVQPAWIDKNSTERPPVENEMITPDTLELTLAGGESVSVPFVFTSVSTVIRNRQCYIKFNSAKYGHTALMAEIDVNPMHFVVNRTLYVQGISHELNKVHLILHNQDNDERFVCTTDPNAIVQMISPSEISIKYRPADFVNGEFYVLSYRDEYSARLDAIYKVVVQVSQRLDFHGVIGQRIPKELLVKGDKYSRRVQVFTSNPGETEINPRKPFQLVAGAFNKVDVIYCPIAQTVAGTTRSMTINMVDTDTNELVDSWLVRASASLPQISKTFDLDVPLHESAHKKIAYVNPWNGTRLFMVRTNEPNTVKVKQPVIEIAGNSKGFIRFWFAACHTPITKDILVFINDQYDQNEECLLIRVAYS